MSIEVKVLTAEGVYATANLVSSVIVGEVLAGKLPYCDLGDLAVVT